MQKRHTKLSEHDFTQIKALTKVGLSANQVAAVVNRSNATVRLVHNATDFKHFTELQKERNTKYPKKPAEVAEVVEKGEPQTITDVRLDILDERLVKLTDLLEQLRSDVNFIAEHMPVNPRKNRFF